MMPLVKSMSAALLNLTEAQSKFLEALGEKEAAIAALMYVDALKKGGLKEILMFHPLLIQFIHPNHPLMLMSTLNHLISLMIQKIKKTVIKRLINFFSKRFLFCL